MILKIKVRCNPDAADPKQTMGVTVRVWGGGAGMAPLRAGCAGDCWWAEGERQGSSARMLAASQASGPATRQPWVFKGKGSSCCLKLI